MANYNQPSGGKVETPDAAMKRGSSEWGISPDVEIDLTAAELRTIAGIKKDNEKLYKAGADDRGEAVKRYSAAETLEADRQLAAGVLALKSKMIRADVLKSEQ